MSEGNRILVTRSSMPPYEEYCNEILDLWDSRWLTNRGSKHVELERALQHYLGVEYVDLFVNGHSALECVFEALGLGDDGRDEVVTTPFTFASTTHAIVRTGLKPVFCDIKNDDLTIDPDKIEALVTDKTCAIVPVHVYGNVCDAETIADIAKRHDLKVVYDAAHAFGVKVDGVGVGNFGDASMFSFHATKVFHSIEGGAIAHSCKELSERLAQWRNFGIVNTEEVAHVGGNSKMNEFSAAMGLCNLRHIDEEIAKRKAVAERYWNNLDGVAGLRTIKPNRPIEQNYAYMPVVVDPVEFGATRDDVMAALDQNGIGARKYFYPLVNDFACYRDQHDSRETPIAKKAADSVITLPMFADLSLSDVDRICGIVVGLSAS